MLIITLAAALTDQIAGIGLVALFWIGLLLSIAIALSLGKERIVTGGQLSILAGLTAVLVIYLGRYGYDGMTGAGWPLTALLVLGSVLMAAYLFRTSQSKRIAVVHS